MTAIMMLRNITDYSFRARRRTADVQPGMEDVLHCDDKCLFDEQNQTFPGPLMSNKMQKEDLIRFIQGKSQECLLHVDDHEQRASYFFWNIMELYCKQNGEVMMAEVAIVLFRSYRCLRINLSKIGGFKKMEQWCLSLATLLCTAVPKDELIKAVIDLGDSLANQDLTYAAHLCYVVASMECTFDLIGYESLPVTISAAKDAIERTEVYEYVLSLTTGLALPNFQEFKFLYAFMLFASGFSAQALDYCEVIARGVTTFPDRITNSLLDQLIKLSKALHEGKQEEPEWLQNLCLLQEEEAAAPSNSCTKQEQDTETPPSPEAPTAPEDYCSRSQQHRAFSFLTEEVTSKYTIGDLLGHGGGGAVYEGVRKADGTEVAVKFVLTDELNGNVSIPGDTRILPVEVGLMEMVSKKFQSPYVLELLDWFDIPNYTVLILERPRPCMDLLNFCELYGGKLPEPLVRDIMVQVLQAVRHCCDSGVFHNDIKPENILINTQTLQIKLIDFGGGDLLKDTPYKYCPGTPDYHPPEWYRHRQYMGRPTTVWTLGIVLFRLLHGDVPFLTSKEIINGRLHFAPGLSTDCCKLISWCLEQKPESRPTFRQIFKNRWIMAGDPYIKSFPVIGGLLHKVIELYDYYRKD